MSHLKRLHIFLIFNFSRIRDLKISCIIHGFRQIQHTSEIMELIKIDPQYFDCQNILGLLYDQLCLPEKAISAYQEALRINPGHVQVHNNLGMVYLKMNNLDLAVQEFQQTLSKYKDPMITSLAQGNLGRVYLMQGYLEMAIKNFNGQLSLMQLIVKSILTWQILTIALGISIRPYMNGKGL